MGRTEPSHLRALLRYLRALGGRSDGAWAPARGTRVEVDDLTPSSGRLRRYLRVTGGAGVAAYAGEGLLPPVYAALWETALLLDLLREAGCPLPRSGLVHLGGERVYARASPAGERYRLTLRLEEAVAAKRGARIAVRSHLALRSGRLCREGRIHLLLPGLLVVGRGEVIREAAPRSAPRWREVTRWRISTQSARRYALVSGDLNPVHLSLPTARLLGYPRPILHGFCTEAMIAHALTERVLGGEGEGVRRLSIRLPAPLLLPAEVVLRVAEAEPPGLIAFRLDAGCSEGRPFAAGEIVAG